jgi:FAD/FMN-containing dehydrogenase
VELALRHVEGVANPLAGNHEWYVLCELSSFADEALDALLESALADASAAGLVQDAALCANERQRAQLWRLRENVPEAQRRAGPSLKHDISVPISALGDFVAAASNWVQLHVPAGTLVAYGHAGDGNLHFNISFPRSTSAEFLAREEPLIRRAIHDLVDAHGGSFSAEHGIGRLKVGELEHYASPVSLAMMREVKRALDPNGIMNPGKLLAK